MKDAMAAMKAELGDDAVILHSKKYKEGGLLGIGSREVVEITAAVEESSLPKKKEPINLQHPTVLTRYTETIKTEKTPPDVEEESPPVEENPPPVEENPQPVEENPQPVEENPQPVEEESPPVEENLPPVEENLPPVEENPPTVEENPPPQPQQNIGFTQEQIAQTQAMIMAQFNQMRMMQQAAIAQAQAQAQEQIRIQQVQAQQAAIAQPVHDSHNEEKIKHLEDEIAQMKALLAEVLGREPKKGSISLHEALKLQEVSEEILSEMAAQSNAGDTLVDVHAPAAKSTLINYLNEHIKFSDGVKLNRHGVRIAALLGTTGASNNAPTSR